MAFFTRFKPSRSSGVRNDAPSLVQPQFKESCEIGNMIRRALTGDTSVFGNPLYLDTLGAPEDFADAQFRLAQARTVWNDLPDHVKQTYGSPENLLTELDRKLAERAKRPSATVKPTETTPPKTVTAKADASSTDAAHAPTT